MGDSRRPGLPGETGPSVASAGQALHLHLPTGSGAFSLDHQRRARHRRSGGEHMIDFNPWPVRGPTRRSAPVRGAGRSTIACMLLRRKLRTFMALVAVLAAALLWAPGGGAWAAPADDDRPATGRQLLFFNHAYGVLDRETADAIEHSAYLREFADFQVRTTTGSDGQTWTGRYLMGRETYLELFGVGDLPGKDSALGSAGMGVSTERAGDRAKAIERLRDLGVTAGRVPADA